MLVRGALLDRCSGEKIVQHDGGCLHSMSLAKGHSRGDWWQSRTRLRFLGSGFGGINNGFFVFCWELIFPLSLILGVVRECSRALEIGPMGVFPSKKNSSMRGPI